LSRTLQNVQCSRSDNKHFTICSVSLFSCLFQILVQEESIAKQLLVCMHLSLIIAFLLL
jgi:hypothetical protein